MFYEQVCKLCFEHGIKPTALSRKLGLSPSAPGRWKTGSLPKAETVKKIADYFGVTTDFLLGVESHHMDNSMGNINNSAVVQGSVGSSINVSNGDQLQGDEAELLSVFRSLNRKSQIAVLNFAYEQESQQK